MSLPVFVFFVIVTAWEIYKVLLECFVIKYWDDFPYQLNQIKTKQDPDGGRRSRDDLALTSLTIADAREVFVIVIEKQLMWLYAMEIYCKHINERDWQWVKVTCTEST